MNIDALPTILTSYFSSLVATINKERKGVPSARKDFMDLLLELRNAGEIQGYKKHENDKERSLKITDELMAAQAFVIYAGGYETSATTLGFMMHELAYNQDVQDKLVEEMNKVLKEYDGKVTYDSLKQMTYLDQVISETLRKYPIVDPLTRQSEATYKVPYTDLTIEKGSLVLISARGIHYDPQYYPDPHKFDPERFTPENTKSRHPCAYMPFGLGPRNCIGMRFAHVQMRVCAVRMLTRYRVQPARSSTRTLTYDVYRVIVGTASPLRLDISPRT